MPYKYNSRGLFEKSQKREERSTARKGSAASAKGGRSYSILERMDNRDVDRKRARAASSKKTRVKLKESSKSRWNETAGSIKKK